MKVKVFLLGLLFMALAATSQGQSYQTAIGGRFGYFNGVTVKHFISGSNALEGIVSTRWKGFIITGLYEFQKSIPGASGLDWEIGGGAHIGLFNADTDEYQESVFGLDFIVGLEYTFQQVPINLALDWKPAFNLSGHGWWGDGFALSARFHF